MRARAVARPDLVYRPLVQGGMVYDPSTRRVHHLNATAAAAWEACSSGATPEEAASQVAARFDVGWKSALEDVRQLLALMRREGLLVEQDG